MSYDDPTPADLARLKYAIERDRELRARWRFVRWLAVGIALFWLLFAVALTSEAHTSDERDAWFAAWQLEVTAAGGLTPELLEAHRDFTQRHQPPLVRSVQARTVNAPTPAPTPVAYTVGVEQWRTAIAAYAGWDVDTMLRIMACESRGNPTAVSHTDDHGLLQIHWPIWGPHFGVTRAQLHDPATNIDIAWRVWAQQGYNAWVCY